MLIKSRIHTILSFLRQHLFANVFLLALIYFLLSISIGWYGTLCEPHGFRQTQTAISVSALLKGGAWLAYETPIFGPPWSIPMEFPLFQWIVALTAKTGLMDIDQAGRLVSVLFFLATLYPLYRILGSFLFSMNQRFMFLTIYCLSPLYIYWSRSFMIESSALALAVWYLWLTIAFLARSKPGHYNLIQVAIMVLGCLAAMVKITTFFAFGAAAALVWLVTLLRSGREARRTLYPAVLSVFVAPAAAVVCWTSYADHLKRLNPIGEALVSSALNTWNFGTINQRFSLDTWRRFFEITLPDVIGSNWLPFLALVACFYCTRRTFSIFCASLFLFALPLIIFTNLQYVHSYYAYANGVFLIAAVALVFADMAESSSLSKRVFGISLFVLTIALSMYQYSTTYRLYQGQGDSYALAAADIHKFTGKDDVILVIGQDYSPELPYYADRRAVMIPFWLELGVDAPYFQKVQNNLRAGGYQVGSVVFDLRAAVPEEVADQFLNAFGFRENFFLQTYPQMVAFFKK